MKVVVTGANGQVGQELCARITALGWQLIALDVAGLDITDEQAVSELLLKESPNLVINAAAYTAVDKAEEQVDLAYAVNESGSINLAKATATLNIPLLHISTDYVFEGNKEGVYQETDVTGPTGVYGKSKLAGDVALAKLNSQHIILRTAWVFGQQGNNFVKTMLKLADREELGVVADQYGSPTYAGDIAAALLTIAEKVQAGERIAWGVYHFTGLPYVNWAEFAEYIFEQAKAQKLLTDTPKVNHITTADYPTPATRPANSKLACGKIQQAFGIEASDWQAALLTLHKYQIH
ncbi:dTDP-4-dehydrorhamnose reductase [Motilimonas pumila]|uniref:dTDP-4-dehydrorhamnose reductase n=1 Tax=Motilimonas pumila TaxID=2303987 RepID=A0A418YDT4_9GAMM|nr:dTDP-4-dehydrorhamnose reductase [Motilimonas pumila]RJG42695.1 dTDP-4-dehydrorhamnose reductase [Motilimonas pumila]